MGAALSLSAALLLACASSESQHAAPGSANGSPGSRAPGPLEITGRVTATGSEPFVLLVIVTDAGLEYELVGERAEVLWDLQQRHVTVRGRVVRAAHGPGFPARLQVDSYTLVRER